MNVFGTIGPVMTGSSGSRTAGAVRPGRAVSRLIDGRPLQRKVFGDGQGAEEA